MRLHESYVPLKFLMTNFRISFGFDDPFVGILIGGPVVLFTAEKFGRFLPFSAMLQIGFVKKTRIVRIKLAW